MELKNVTIAYGVKKVLKNLNITINSGEFVFLIGYSGSGKSSFIKTLIGELKPIEWIILDHKGQNIYEYSSRELIYYRRNIWIIFQDYKLLRNRTVRENVAFAMEVCGYSDSKIVNRAPEVLTQVGILHKKDAFINTLSGGEAQRVAIARALIHDPHTIIGDEPTGDLDPHNAEEIISILLELNRAGKTIIIATHDDKLVNRLKKRVITFKDGKVFSDIKEGEYNI